MCKLETEEESAGSVLFLKKNMCTPVEELITCAF